MLTWRGGAANSIMIVSTTPTSDPTSAPTKPHISRSPQASPFTAGESLVPSSSHGKARSGVSQRFAAHAAGNNRTPATGITTKKWCCDQARLG
jgi:hypothetical protein